MAQRTKNIGVIGIEEHNTERDCKQAEFICQKKSHETSHVGTR